MSCFDWLLTPTVIQPSRIRILIWMCFTVLGITTYTPRLVSLNLQGSLGSISSHGTLYNEVAPVPSYATTWTGNVSTHASEPYKKNLFLKSLCVEEQENLTMANGVNSRNDGSKREFLDKDIVESLENGVQFWTDFSKVHYHPKSLYELSGVWMGVQDFDNYGIGWDAFSWTSQGEEISERLRFFVEDCDDIQPQAEPMFFCLFKNFMGFLVTTAGVSMDDSGGFSSVAADFLENIADEYTNTPILLFSVRGPTPDINPESRKQAVSRDLHDAVSFSRLSPYCKLIVPTGLPRLSGSKASRFLNIVDEKPYHCSAVYAAALLSISLPFRMEPVGPTASSSYVSGAMDVNEVVQMLAGQARQNMVQILDVAMPAPSLSGKQNEMTLLENLLPLTPDVAENVEDLQAVEFMTVLGALSEGHRASVSQVRDLVHAAFQHIDTRPVFFHLAVSLCPLPIPLTFPSIFSNLVGQQGELVGSPISESSSRGSLDVHSIPMAARLRSSSAVLPLLQSRLRNLHGLGIQRGAPGAQLLRSWGFEKDELEEMGEMLSKMVVALDSHQISSDSD